MNRDDKPIGSILICILSKVIGSIHLNAGNVEDDNPCATMMDNAGGMMKKLIGFLAMACLTMMACSSTDEDGGSPASGGTGAQAAGAAGQAAGTGGSSPAGSGGAAGNGSGATAGAGAEAGTGGGAGQAGFAGEAGGGGAAAQGGTAGAAGQAGNAGSAGTGTDPLEIIGCSDGSREGFANISKFPFIAACNGAWDQAGIFDRPPKCNRQAGNDGANSAGTGCTVSDLCAEGWHVCYGRDDVLLRNEDGCLGVMDGATSPVFFTTQMSSTGAFECSTGATATNDLFGCGDLGCNFSSDPVVQQLCAPLIMSSHDLCKGLRNDLGCGDWCNHLGKHPKLGNAWDCGKDTTKEALNVKKTRPDQQGGVLCCKD